MNHDVIHESVAPTSIKARKQFSLRSYFAMISGVAFVAYVTRWFLSDLDIHPVIVASMVIPWAVASFCGIAFATRCRRSILAGAMIAGALGTLTFPGLMILYLYLNSLNGVRSLNGLWMMLLYAACGSGLLAAIIGILRDGVSLRGKR